MYDILDTHTQGFTTNQIIAKGPISKPFGENLNKYTKADVMPSFFL